MALDPVENLCPGDRGVTQMSFVHCLLKDPRDKFSPSKCGNSILYTNRMLN